MHVNTCYFFYTRNYIAKGLAAQFIEKTATIYEPSPNLGIKKSKRL